MKVALVHDYLKEFGGAERVLEALHELFPEAPIFTAYLSLAGLGPHAKRVEKWDIRTSWMQKIPFANKLISPLRIFAPMTFEGFDLSNYDLIISSCNTYFAKAVITKPGSLHLSYIHTPPRYLYGYTTSFNYKKHWWTKILGELANHFLRVFDFEVSQRPNILIANSKNVAERIKKFYRRDSVVIYPPVILATQSEAWRRPESHKKRSWSSQDDSRTGKYFLSVGRLVRGKGVEIIVEACTKLGLPLKVVGIGPQLEELKKLAGKSVEFLGEVKDEEIGQLYAGAQATIVASEDEDFGIVSVESQVCGTPVIAVKAGGFLETVVGGLPAGSQGKTGEFFESAGYDNSDQTAENLIKVLENFDPKKYRSENCRKNAQKFSQERFKKEILELVEKNLRV